LKRFVYVAGPFSDNPMHRANETIKIADQIVAAGHVPFVPHLYLLWDVASPHSYEYWMELCLAWVGRCDVLLRLHGASKGADREALHARNLAKPVVYSIEELSRLADMK
jgi:hypothetical protein